MPGGSATKAAVTITPRGYRRRVRGRIRGQIPIDAGVVVRLRDAIKVRRAASSHTRQAAAPAPLHHPPPLHHSPLSPPPLSSPQLLDELSWEALLVRLITLWEVDDPNELDPSLKSLSTHLATAPYYTAPVEVKACALHALCERALDRSLNAELRERAEELEMKMKDAQKAVRASPKPQSPIAKPPTAQPSGTTTRFPPPTHQLSRLSLAPRHRRLQSVGRGAEEESALKQLAKAKKALVAERWREVEGMEAEVRAISEERSNAIIHQDGEGGWRR